MERFNYYYDYAYESPLYQVPPPVVEDICMAKSRASVKLKKRTKSEISTADESWDDSSNLETQSSTLSKKSRKRRSKKFSEASGSTTEVNYSITEIRSENPVGAKHTPLITLSCPLCSDPECVLNVAASCPLLRHNESEVVRCGLCEENCDCHKCKSKLLPVSGLVARDENGVAETLLKVNGGPIENSWEWANRRRWDVPYGVNWDHQVGQWITSRMLDSSKTLLEGAHRKRSKSRFKRKSKLHSAAPTSTLTQVPTHTDTSNQEHKVEDQRVILEGIGFKIINRGQEKILINFDKKNCKVLGCSCQNEDKTCSNCGCDGWRKEGHAKKCDKRKSTSKVGKSGGRISLMKETSHGMVEVNMKELEKVDEEKRISSGKNDVGGQIDDIKENKTEAAGTRKSQEHETIPDKPKNKKEDKKGKQNERENSSKTGLTGMDVRHLSRTDVLEEHLRTLGPSCKQCPKTNEQVASCPSTGNTVFQPEVMMPSMKMLSPCMCAERYGYTSA